MFKHTECPFLFNRILIKIYVVTLLHLLIVFICNDKDGKPLIGFIGLGNMGNHMARNLVSKGYPVLVYDVNTAAVEGLKEAGN